MPLFWLRRPVSRDCIRHHPVPPNPRFPTRVKTGRFCGDFRRYCSPLLVSGEPCGLSWRILASRLCIQKFRSPRPGCDGPVPLASPGILGAFGTTMDLSNPGPTYRGFNPRASNCWLHSAGASRSRSTPIPRGKRPSTAARTRSGARNASEIVHVDLAHAAFLAACNLLNIERSQTKNLMICTQR